MPRKKTFKEQCSMSQARIREGQPIRVRRIRKAGLRTIRRLGTMPNEVVDERLARLDQDEEADRFFVKPDGTWLRHVEVDGTEYTMHLWCVRLEKVLEREQELWDVELERRRIMCKAMGF